MENSKIPSYRVQLAGSSRSLTVQIDKHGNVTTSADVVLDDGKYTIFSKQDGEVGAFKVTEGVVGTAYSFAKEIRVYTLELSTFFNLIGSKEKTEAQEIDSCLSLLERRMLAFNGEVCTCGEIHKIQPNRRKRMWFEFVEAMRITNLEELENGIKELPLTFGCVYTKNFRPLSLLFYTHLQRAFSVQVLELQ